MLAQRKYESRVASSCCVRRTVAGPLAAPGTVREVNSFGSPRSMRNRKSGDTRIAWSAAVNPSSNECVSASTDAARRSSFATSPAVTGRR